MISPLVKWDHKENYAYLKFDDDIRTSRAVEINILDPEYEFITGHEIDREFSFKLT